MKLYARFCAITEQLRCLIEKFKEELEMRFVTFGLIKRSGHKTENTFESYQNNNSHMNSLCCWLFAVYDDCDYVCLRGARLWGWFTWCRSTGRATEKAKMLNKITQKPFCATSWDIKKTFMSLANIDRYSNPHLPAIVSTFPSPIKMREKNSIK